MKLKGRIEVLSKYKGSSKFDFWKNLIPGDYINISLDLKNTGRGRNGLYAPMLVINKEDTNEVFKCSMNELCNYLEKVDHIDINEKLEKIFNV